MAVTRVCYCSREDVMAAPDFRETMAAAARIDRVICSAAENIEAHLHRKFYPQAATRYFDWPTRERGYPWRLWLNQHEVISVSQLTAGGVAIPANQYFLEPVNSGPPYNRIDLDRSTSAAFTGAATPQHAIGVTGVFGGWAATVPAGTLAAAVTTTTATTIQVSDSSALGAGDTVLIDSERMLVTDRAMVTTGQAQQGAGAGTASAADVALTVTDGTKYAVGEQILLDSERMLITDIAGNVLTVKRAWSGSVLATHSGATVYAPRLLTVARGTQGTAAATHLTAAAVAKQIPPGLVGDLAIAESVNRVFQETGGYASETGSGETARAAPGAGLADLWDEAVTAYARQVRQRVI